MNDFVWKDEYSVGIHLLDEEHKVLIRLIHQLSQASQLKDGQQTLRETMTVLQEYVATHFTVEEEFMRAYRYRGYEAHKMSHDVFRSRIVELSKHLKEGEIETLGSIFMFLKHWLKTHIQSVDKELGAFLALQSLTNQQKPSCGLCRHSFSEIEPAMVMAAKPSEDIH